MTVYTNFCFFVQILSTFSNIFYLFEGFLGMDLTLCISVVFSDHITQTLTCHASCCVAMRSTCLHPSTLGIPGKPPLPF